MKEVVKNPLGRIYGKRNLQRGRRKFLLYILFLCLIVSIFFLVRQHQALTQYYEAGMPFCNYFYSSIRTIEGGIGGCADGYSEQSAYLIYQGIYQLEDIREEMESYCEAGPEREYERRGKDRVIFQDKETLLREGAEGGERLEKNLQQMMEAIERWMQEEERRQNPEGYQAFMLAAESYITEVGQIIQRYTPVYPLTPEGLMEWYITVMGEVKELPGLQQAMA